MYRNMYRVGFLVGEKGREKRKAFDSWARLGWDTRMLGVGRGRGRAGSAGTPNSISKGQEIVKLRAGTQQTCLTKYCSTTGSI